MCATARVLRTAVVRRPPLQGRDDGDVPNARANAVRTGGVPLPVLDEYLEAWIKGGGIGPYPEMEK